MASGIDKLVQWFRGLAQLRHPALVRMLGAMREEAELWEEVRRHNPGAKVERGVVFKRWRPGQLSLGAGASVCLGTILSCSDPVRGRGRIVIGEGSWIGQYNNLRTCPDSDITIGRNCLISQFCTLVASNHGTRRDGPVKTQGMDTSRLGIELGDDVWLGAGVTVLPGVAIGTGAVIAANSVVTEHVPPYEIWAGSPASRKGERT